MQPNRVLETCIYVDDLEAAESFYGGVLGLEQIDRLPERHVFFRAGPGVFLVFIAAESDNPHGELPPHGAAGASHVAFAVAGDEIEMWKQLLSSNHIEIEKEYEWPQGGRSLYFRDPAGNSIELAEARIWGIEEQG